MNRKQITHERALNVFWLDNCESFLLFLINSGYYRVVEQFSIESRKNQSNQSSQSWQRIALSLANDDSKYNQAHNQKPARLRREWLPFGIWFSQTNFQRPKLSKFKENPDYFRRSIKNYSLISCLILKSLTSSRIKKLKSVQDKPAKVILKRDLSTTSKFCTGKKQRKPNRRTLPSITRKWRKWV